MIEAPILGVNHHDGLDLINALGLVARGAGTGAEQNGHRG
jgi:hypothetical protein